MGFERNRTLHAATASKDPQAAKQPPPPLREVPVGCSRSPSPREAKLSRGVPACSESKKPLDEMNKKTILTVSLPR